MQTRPRRSLRVPAALAVVVLGGCQGGSKPVVDAKIADGATHHDAAVDAGMPDTPIV
jgi:hypothetical protein